MFSLICGWRRRRCAPRPRSLIVEALETRELLTYTALQDTPLVYGSTGFIGGVVKTPPQNGSVILVAGGGWRYVPATGFTGVDSFAITVANGGYTPKVYVAPPIPGALSGTAASIAQFVKSRGL